MNPSGGSNRGMRLTSRRALVAASILSMAGCGGNDDRPMPPGSPSPPSNPVTANAYILPDAVSLGVWAFGDEPVVIYTGERLRWVNFDALTHVIVADSQSTRGVYPKIFIASGKAAPAHAPAGTIVHVPYTDLLNADNTPRPAKDIWNILAKAGVSRYAELVCISDDPGEAAANYFILTLMGYPDVKILSK